MNPFREAPVKIKYTMSRSEIREACREWLENRRDLSINDIQGLDLIHPGDGSVVVFIEAVLEIEE